MQGEQKTIKNEMRRGGNERGLPTEQAILITLAEYAGEFFFN